MKLIDRDTCINGHNLRDAEAIVITTQNTFICRSCAKEAQARFRALNRPAKRESVHKSQVEILEDHARRVIARNNARIETLESKVAAIQATIEKLRAETARVDSAFLGGE